MVDVEVPSESNIVKNEHEKLDKYQELKEELQSMWGVKASVVKGSSRDVHLRMVG